MHYWWNAVELNGFSFSFFVCVIIPVSSVWLHSLESCWERRVYPVKPLESLSALLGTVEPLRCTDFSGGDSRVPERPRWGSLTSSRYSSWRPDHSRVNKHLFLHFETVYTSFNKSVFDKNLRANLLRFFTRAQNAANHSRVRSVHPRGATFRLTKTINSWQKLEIVI